MTITKLVLAVVAAAFLSGCITSQTLIKLRPDGSGTIEQTTTMGAEAMAQLAGMAAAFGKESGAAASPPPDFFSEAEARAAASKMGGDVKFVSSEKIKTAEAEGLRAIYAFTDITKLRINQKPNAPGGATMSSDNPEDIGFHFVKSGGGNSVVTVIFPEPKFDASATTAESAKSGARPSPQDLAMAKQLFKGLKIAIDLSVDGRIVSTNSPFVAGNRVTLLEMDFEELLSNDALLASVQQPKSIEEAKKLLKGVKGFKINLDREVKVEFSAR